MLHQHLLAPQLHRLLHQHLLLVAPLDRGHRRRSGRGGGSPCPRHPAPRRADASERTERGLLCCLLQLPRLQLPRLLLLLPRLLLHLLLLLPRLLLHLLHGPSAGVCEHRHCAWRRHPCTRNGRLLRLRHLQHMLHLLLRRLPPPSRRGHHQHARHPWHRHALNAWHTRCPGSTLQLVQCLQVAQLLLHDLLLLQERLPLSRLEEGCRLSLK
jgi:hypothetical protein